MNPFTSRAASVAPQQFPEGWTPEQIAADSTLLKITRNRQHRRNPFHLLHNYPLNNRLLADHFPLIQVWLLMSHHKILLGSYLVITTGWGKREWNFTL
ncbi:hypothetical protein AX16_010565 [Volvariella volvacea WC 439]|nr:hypothetical protein AX16_010565 [Volvariella volvacea WC 439]